MSGATTSHPRDLPSVDSVLKTPAAAALVERFGRPAATAAPDNNVAAICHGV